MIFFKFHHSQILFNFVSSSLPDRSYNCTSTNSKQVITKNYQSKVMSEKKYINFLMKKRVSKLLIIIFWIKLLPANFQFREVCPCHWLFIQVKSIAFLDSTKYSISPTTHQQVVDSCCTKLSDKEIYDRKHLKVTGTVIIDCIRN